MQDPRIPGAIVAVLGAASILLGVTLGLSNAVEVVLLAAGAVLALLGAVMVFRASGKKDTSDRPDA